MSYIFMFLYFLLLILVTYPLLIYILFKGKQYNKIFATFLLTILPVIGSVPGVIMASQYEERINLGPFNKITDKKVSQITLILQSASVLLLLFPLFRADGAWASGFNLIFGLKKDGVYLVEPAYILLYFVFAPAVISGLKFLKTKTNIKNVVVYILSLITSLLLCAVSFFSDAASFTPTIALWLFCIAQTITMFFALVSLLRVRNRFLEKLEAQETSQTEDEQNPKETPSTVYNGEKLSDYLPPINTYKCAKCGKYVEKGTICSCRKDSQNKLDRIMEEQNKKVTSDFCVYCKTALAPGEVCKCTEGSFGITVKPEQFEGRKCKYCGQILIGDSKCVCEKILENSKPADDYVKESSPKSFFGNDIEEKSHISEEMAELEKKIEERLTKVKSSLSNSEK